MTEEDLREIEQLGGKPADLVAEYRALQFVARQARRLGYVAGEALVSGSVSSRHVERPSGQFMCIREGDDASHSL